MQEFEVVVDFNGIVIFDCEGLQNFYSVIEPGSNIYQRFAKTDDGDEVVKKGIVVPIIGINDSIYRVIVRMADEESIIPKELVFATNSAFPLRVTDRLVIADMAVLLEWSLDEGWQDIDIPAGSYSVAIHGFQRIEENVVVDCGFEIVFTPTSELPEFTAELVKQIKVNELPV
jgi:hypothetical protein